MEPSDALRAFRRSLYECFHRRADALFELADAILTADAVPSPVHLSLQASHRRGWGSLYAALAHGTIDAEALSDLLVRHPLALGDADEPPVSRQVAASTGGGSMPDPLPLAGGTSLLR